DVCSSDLFSPTTAVAGPSINAAARDPEPVQGWPTPRHQRGMGRTSGGRMTSERRRPPALRVRDVVPAGIGIVLLLGVAGCMGAYGGGPLGGDDGGTPEPTSTAEPVSPAPSPSFVVEPPDEGTPEYLGDFAEQLAESKKSGAAPDAFTNRKPLFSCGEFVLGQGA